MKYNFNKMENRKGTFCTQWDYIADRFGSDDVLPFSISDMDFKLPDELIEYLQDQLKSGIYGYTRWRNDLLLGAIKSWYEKRYGLNIDCNNIAYSPTVIFSIGVLVRSLSRPGDNILTFIPAYDAFFKLIKGNNRNLIKSEMCVANNKYSINKDDFEKKIKDCKILLLCSPYNPIGKVWTYEELEYIINICKKNNVPIISDEIHMDVTFAKNHIPALKVARDLDYSQNITIVTSATKSFNFPGLLFSYVVSDNIKFLEEFILSIKEANGLSSPTILGMHATAYVYNNLDDWLDELVSYIHNNYLYIKDRMKNYNIIINDFEGTYLLWLDVSHYDLDKLLYIMYNKTKVGFMSGEVYGMDNHLRINIGCSREKLIMGMDRFEEALNLMEES